MQINIKNRPHYLFNDMINIESFDRILLRLTKLLRQNDDGDDGDLVIYHITYVRIKYFDHVFDKANTLCFGFNSVAGYIIEKSNKDEYWIIASTIQNKKY